MDPASLQPAYKQRRSQRRLVFPFWDPDPGDLFSYEVPKGSFVDPTGGQLTLSVKPLPAWLTFDGLKLNGAPTAPSELNLEDRPGERSVLKGSRHVLLCRSCKMEVFGSIGDLLDAFRLVYRLLARPTAA